MLGECLLRSHDVICRCHVFRDSFQLRLIVERIGVISRELERDLFLSGIFQFLPLFGISPRWGSCARAGANHRRALVVPDAFQ
jgi:hypothetical protein